MMDTDQRYLSAPHEIGNVSAWLEASIRDTESARATLAGNALFAGDVTELDVALLHLRAARKAVESIDRTALLRTIVDETVEDAGLKAWNRRRWPRVWDETAEGELP